MDNFMKRVSAAQSELKAPKGQYNSFGKYKYRSCEDILEAAKPICAKHGLVLTIGDRLENIGERYYVHACATLTDTETDGSISNDAYAREAADKKGMDESQITGTASSYARKYALNGLFCIDDTKDADTPEYTQGQKDEAPEKPGNRTPPEGDKEVHCAECGIRFADYWDGHDLIKAAALGERSIKAYGRILCGKCARIALDKQYDALR